MGVSLGKRPANFRHGGGLRDEGGLECGELSPLCSACAVFGDNSFCFDSELELGDQSAAGSPHSNNQNRTGLRLIHKPVAVIIVAAFVRKDHNMKQSSFTAVLEKEGSEFVALCPELDVASQGETIESAMTNLREAVELFLECASPEELQQRIRHEVFVTRFEAAYA